MRAEHYISILVICFMGSVSFYGLGNIAPDAMLPSHWNMKGEVDGYSSRNTLLVFAPAIGVIVTIIFSAIPYIDPRRHNVLRSSGLYFATWFGSLGLLAVIHFVVIIAGARGVEPNTNLILLPICALLAIVGNYMAKSRSSWFIGLRTPWTLTSERAWIAANRTAGWLFVLTGAASATSSYVKDTESAFIIMGAGLLASAMIGVFVSYRTWRNDPERAR